MLRSALIRLAACCLIAGASLPASAQQHQVQAAGASFPSQVYLRWAESYSKAAGVQVSYQATGSGDGIKRISARQVQIGGSDSPLSPEELAQRQLLQIPMLVGGVVPVVRLPGVPNGRLRLTGELLADIMRGELTHWNDTRIAAHNPGIALPALRIKRVVRSDKSGTTEGFSRYLAAVSPRFASEIGASQLPAWPGEVLAAQGNDGVSALLKNTDGALAYVSYDRVGRDALSSVQLRNREGRWVAPSEAGFMAAIRHSELQTKGDDRASLLDRPGADSWPLTLTSFALIDARPPRAAAAVAPMRFLYWCFLHGDELTRGTGFAPLPVRIQSKLAARLAEVRAQDGAPITYLAL